MAISRPTLRSHQSVEIILPLLFLGGLIAVIIAVILLIFSLAVSKLGVIGMALLFGGLGSLACAQLFQVLSEIERHLAAIRSQLEKGVLGLLG
jgi:hypothetical protein